MDTISGLVSIVIPCFNAGETLMETLECALADGACEVIVVDDGSDEERTLRVLRTLPSEVVLIRQPNQGLSAARNAGIRRARGEYILPLDADDLIDSKYVPEARGVLESRPEVGIVYCRAVKFGEVTGPWNLPDFSVERLLLENCIFSAAMFRRADWERVGGYDEGMRRGREDHDFWLRLVGLGRDVHRLDGTFFHYRIRASSMNHGYTREEYVAIYSRIFTNNIELYLQHPDALIRHRFELMDQLNDLRHRYQPIESAIQRYPRAYDVLRHSRRALRRDRT